MEYYSMVGIGYPNYQISRSGEILGHRGIKKWSINDSGYYSVCLQHVSGRRENIAVHRLVALMFIPKPRGTNHVRFKDGKQSNIHPDNLEWH